jgi:Uma2 family endonuclease
MAATTLVSVEEYLRSDYEPDMDFVDGVLEERNVGEFDHGDLQLELLVWLRTHGTALNLYPCISIRTQISPTRFRVLDMVILRGKRKRGQRFVTSPPEVAIEILATNDSPRRVQCVVDDCLQFGIPQVWVIDPLNRRAWVYTRGECHEALDRILRIEDPAVAIPLDEIFASIDRNIQP